jgi:hypothetical protein
VDLPAADESQGLPAYADAVAGGVGARAVTAPVAVAAYSRSRAISDTIGRPGTSCGWRSARRSRHPSVSPGQAPSPSRYRLSGGWSRPLVDDHVQPVASCGERPLDVVLCVGRGEDEAQVAVPVRERADALADGDGDGQAGDSRDGGRVGAALDRAACPGAEREA